MTIDERNSQGRACPPNMLADLRASTSAAHERLDASFGSLDLTQEDGFIRFLRAHAVGMKCLFPAFADFVETTLGIDCPDLMGMLERDLQSLGIPLSEIPDIVPSPALRADHSGAGVAYVVCGSRLGLEVIRRGGYWGSGTGFRSLYMEDDLGRACWKALVPWLRDAQPASQERDEVLAAAIASFEAFANAFAVSAGNCKHLLEADG